METLFASQGLIALCTALAGVLLFGLAPRLPSLFPASFARFIGVGAVCASLAPLWVLTGSWYAPAVVGCVAVGMMAGVHWRQTRCGTAQDARSETEKR